MGRRIADRRQHERVRPAVIGTDCLQGQQNATLVAEVEQVGEFLASQQSGSVEPRLRGSLAGLPAREERVQRTRILEREPVAELGADAGPELRPEPERVGP